MTTTDGRYRIAEVADRTGFSTPTLRYYEEIGLLPPAERTAAGYRLYDDRAIDRLRFVRAAGASSGPSLGVRAAPDGAARRALRCVVWLLRHWRPPYDRGAAHRQAINARPVSAVKENAGILGVGAAACAVCCAGPILGFFAAIGLGTAVGVAVFGVGGLAVALLVLVPTVRRRRRQDACAAPETTPVTVRTRQS
jgi:hypothetical protein